MYMHRELKNKSISVIFAVINLIENLSNYLSLWSHYKYISFG